MFQLLLDENQAQGITGGQFEAGVNDVDTPSFRLEDGATLPWGSTPTATWIDYQCGLEVELDPGMVLHKALPQSAQAADTLATQFLGDTDPEASQLGANLASNGRFTDTVQRMATSSYRFCLRGYGVRAGKQVPIPGLKTIAGVPAIPDAPQRVRPNTVIANYLGVPVYYAAWELWYFVALPPKKPTTPPVPPNLAEHVSGQTVPPAAQQVPWSDVDGNAQPQGPQQGPNGRVIRG